MHEQQVNLPFDAPPAHTAAMPNASACHLHDEVAAIWGLPLGERVAISFRGGQLDAITGTIELLSAPDFPWNPRQPLQLRIAGFTFSSRNIEGWTRS